MPSLEEVCQRIFSDNQWMRKMLIGGLLLLSIIGIPLVLGYFYRYLAQVQYRGKLDLPEWDGFETLFLNGLKVFLVFLLYWFVPILLAMMIGKFFTGLLGGLGLPFAMGCYSFVMFASPAVMVSAVFHLQRGDNIRSILEARSIVAPVVEGWRMLVLPSVALIGLIALTLPVFAFSFFLGFNAFIAYTLLVYARLELNR